MIKVKRKNVILRVPEVDKAHYLAKGYEVIDELGNVVESNKVPTNDDLEGKVVALENENAELKALVEKLKADLAEASKPVEEPVKEEVVEEVKEEELPEEKPAKKSNKKK